VGLALGISAAIGHPERTIAFKDPDYSRAFVNYNRIPISGRFFRSSSSSLKRSGRGGAASPIPFFTSRKLFSPAYRNFSPFSLLTKYCRTASERLRPRG